MIRSIMKLILFVLPLFLLTFDACIAFHQTRSSSRINVNTVLAAGPATIERTTKRTAVVGSAVVDRPITERRNRVDDPVKERQNEGGEAWELRMYNDGTNTREHVARSLVQITGMTEMTAYQTMMHAHQNGIACVGRFCFEIAEMYNEGLHKQGIVSDIVAVDEEKK
mmetsp:Transcript_835/g.884  ORF Transcript_835/g.884 Transcript_835/m.884 type:complete len:167 (+) Transcript_835:310-810(+)|eukprot:CAMPEP_0170825858 /NCGR_PEP_ID=MMETSP0733-20121128/46213_1 /TAXON_ID=186038 /ORGANISM="Fragilariopsis kerguelensis, Strain L26-C5" /LENGTH=166 /DNA_ID=CAMNT_0011189505 /DNA_START=360 /DNA_END=860 /DNA_ORIENTATION=-